MAELSKLRLVLVLLAAGGALLASAIAYWSRGGAVSPSQEVQTAPEIDANDSIAGEPIPLGSRFGCNSPAPPPILFLGPPPRDANDLDLGTPVAAIQTILSLIDRGATDKLTACVLEEAKSGPDGLYPRYLGQPVGLVEVVEEDDRAMVVWEAAVHTGFALQGKRWFAGETMTVTSRLMRVEGLWRLARWHEGDENGEERSQSTN
jgi:hypothetical protein